MTEKYGNQTKVEIKNLIVLILIAIPEEKIKEEEQFCLWVIKEKLDHYFKSIDLDYKFSKEVHKF